MSTEFVDVTVDAAYAPVGVQLWPTRGAEYAPNFTLAGVVRGESAVTWVYESGAERTFRLGESVACRVRRSDLGLPCMWNRVVRRVDDYVGHWRGVAFVTVHEYGEHVHRSEGDALRWNVQRRELRGVS